MVSVPPVLGASSAPSWGALAGALVVVVLAHWLVPRVILPRLVSRRSRPLTEDADPRRWVLTAGTGLATYVGLGLILGMAWPTLLIWGAAFLVGMAVLYRRVAR